MAQLSSAERHNVLRDLAYHWTDTDGGAAYLFDYCNGKWIAARADDSRELIASEPDELRELVIRDYSENPVLRKVVP